MNENEDIKNSGDQDHDHGETAAHVNEASETLDTQAETEQMDPVEILATENADLKDQMLRLVADMENLRKRTAREVADTRSYAIANFARDMLTATDNMGRALSTLSDDARTNADATTKSLIDGIEMTDREMRRLLEKNGIKPILAEGQKFDPHKHQAMFEVPNTEVPEGIIVQVVQPGYAIGERVLRPAMVGVAKGGPKAMPESNKPEADAPEDVVDIRVNKEV